MIFSSVSRNLIREQGLTFLTKILFCIDITSTVVYDPQASTEPGTTVDEYTEFPDQTMSPIPVQEQLEANVFIELGVFFDTADDGTNRAFFNNITYRTVRIDASCVDVRKNLTKFVYFFPRS